MLWFKEIEGPWEELSQSWFGGGIHHSCLKNMEELPYGKRIWIENKPQWSKAFVGYPALNAKQIRWLEFLGNYNFEIKHIKEKENKVVDALNRKVHTTHVTTINIYNFYLKIRILEI